MMMMMRIYNGEDGEEDVKDVDKDDDEEGDL